MARRLAAFAWIGLLSLWAAPARADEDALRLALEKKDVPSPHVEWYGVYLNGTKSGWVRQEFGRSGEGESAAFFILQSGRIQAVAMGKQVAIDLSTRDEFDAVPPYGLRAARHSTTQGDKTQVVLVSRTSEGLSAQVSDAGEVRTLTKPLPDYTLADALTFERWLRAGRATGDKVSVRRFDVDRLEPDTQMFSVLTRKESLVGGVKSAWYEVHQESAQSGDGGVARVDSSGIVLSSVLGGMFETRLETEEQAQKIEYSSDLFVFGQARVDKPLGDGLKVTRLVLAVDGLGAATLASGPRQTVERNANTGAVRLVLGAAAGPGEAATAKGIEEALRETVKYPTKLPQVKELAAKAVGDAKTPREKVARLVPFVQDFVKDEVRPETVSVTEIIASKRGDCSEHTVLFVTLARAAGVPARGVSGLLYMGDDALAFAGHAWAEVALDGKWVPVDPTWGQTELDATHVTLEREGKGKKDMIASLGRLNFRLKEVESKP